ncbi:ankyrin repeat-containing domain protein, partial [Baffinella frigidus]
LHEAAEMGDIGIVQMLLDKGANVNLRSNDSYTPLHRAVLQGHGYMVWLLLDRGAQVDPRTKDGDTP